VGEIGIKLKVQNPNAKCVDVCTVRNLGIKRSLGRWDGTEALVFNGGFLKG